MAFHHLHPNWPDALCTLLGSLFKAMDMSTVFLWDMLGAPNNIAGAPSNLLKLPYYPSLKKFKIFK